MRVGALGGTVDPEPMRDDSKTRRAPEVPRALDASSAPEPESVASSAPIDLKFWDPAALRRALLDQIDYAERFYLVTDRNTGTSLLNTAISTVAEITRNATAILDLGTNTAAGLERLRQAEDGWDYAIGVTQLLADAAEAGGVILGAAVAVGRLRPGVSAGLGEVPGSARTVAAENLRQLGLEGVELQGRSFNSGAKALQKAGFERLPNTSRGRRVFRHPRTGAEVHFDSRGALVPGQKPHWHVRDAAGEALRRAGGKVPLGSYSGHIPAG